ncbi:patatin-like phospholipase family protein [Conexibacter woesei]|nr:patatin-like phospholipase family protein [Conexibacter woesei]
MPSRRGVALVLTATGARGAYEIGALSVVLPELERRGEAVTVLCGAGAGAVNAALLGSLAHLPAAVQVELAIERWQRLARDDAAGSLRFSTLPLTLARLAGDALGLPGIRAGGLLDPQPLKCYLDRHLDWDAVHRNVASGTLDAVCVVATQLATGLPLAFVESATRGAPPDDDDLRYLPTRLTSEHVQASAAIPLVQPAAHVEEPEQARGWYADGATRLTRPLAPARALGAQRLVVVGCEPPEAPFAARGAPSRRLVDVIANMLDGLLVDHIAGDVQRLAASNELAAAEGRRDGAIPYAFVAPRHGRPLGPLAQEAFGRRYGGVRAAGRPETALLGRLLRGRADTGGDLLSILALTPEHVDALVTAGRRDAARWMRSHPGVWRDATEPAVTREPADLASFGERRRRRPRRRPAAVPA